MAKKKKKTAEAPADWQDFTVTWPEPPALKDWTTEGLDWPDLPAWDEPINFKDETERNKEAADA